MPASKTGKVACPQKNATPPIARHATEQAILIFGFLLAKTLHLDSYHAQQSSHPNSLQEAIERRHVNLIRNVDWLELVYVNYNEQSPVEIAFLVEMSKIKKCKILGKWVS